jgi:hypothetical protein
VPSTYLTDRGDHYWIAADGATVTSLQFDFAVTVGLAGADTSFSVRIEEPFTLRRDGADAPLLDPERRPAETAPVLALLDAAVTRIVAFKDGRLVLTFEPAWTIDVPAGHQYEAWTLNGPDGLLLVSMPGGDVAVWT